MHPKQAIKIVDEALAFKTVGTRQDHVMWQQAMAVLQQAVKALDAPQPPAQAEALAPEG